MDCLKRAAKIADLCMSQPKNLSLFVGLLNRYLYYFSLGVEQVSDLLMNSQVGAEEINHLLELIKDHTDQIDDQEAIKDGIKYLNNTKAAIRGKQETDDRFKAIVVQ